jgi:hypothetical protein
MTEQPEPEDELIEVPLVASVQVFSNVASP